MQLTPEVQMGLAQTLSVLFSGISMVVVLTATWNLASKLATITAMLNVLSPVPEKLAVVEKDIVGMKKDIDALWKAFREDCEAREREPAAFTAFLEKIDKRAPQGGD